MKGSFTHTLDVILQFEGGYSDHPSDPGGATNMGITKAVLEEWRGKPVSKADVKALTRLEVEAIYKARYWDACRCDDLPPGLDLVVFDCAVNQGVSRATRLLQGAAGVAQDGQIGPKTMAAVHAATPAVLLCEFMARRMVAYASLTKLFKTFGLGWSRRLLRMQWAASRILAAHDEAV